MKTSPKNRLSYANAPYFDRKLHYGTSVDLDGNPKLRACSCK